MGVEGGGVEELKDGVVGVVGRGSGVVGVFC